MLLARLIPIPLTSKLTRMTPLTIPTVSQTSFEPYLTEDKRRAIFPCKNCGGEVSYRADHPLTNWKDKVHSCLDCSSDPNDIIKDGPLFDTPPAWRSDELEDEQSHTQTSQEAFQKAELSGSIEYLDQTDQGIYPEAEGPPALKDHSVVKLYTVKELQVMLGLSRNRILAFIRHYIDPIDGAVFIGNRKVVHAWALNHALSQRTTRAMKEIKARRRTPKPPSKARLHFQQLEQETISSANITMTDSQNTSSEMPSQSSGEKYWTDYLKEPSPPPRSLKK